MSALAIPAQFPALPATSPEVLEKVKRARERCFGRDQMKIHTDHVLHAGMYARTITMPPNTALVGTLIKIPTLVITVGTAFVLVGEEWIEIKGVRVLPAAANRMQVFTTVRSPLVITMIFPTSAKTVEDAEAEFTDEIDLLLSRKQVDTNSVRVTGE